MASWALQCIFLETIAYVQDTKNQAAICAAHAFSDRRCFAPLPEVWVVARLEPNGGHAAGAAFRKSTTLLPTC